MLLYFLRAEYPNKLNNFEKDDKDDRDDKDEEDAPPTSPSTVTITLLDNDGDYKGLGTPLNRTLCPSQPVLFLHQMSGRANPAFHAIDAT